MAYLGIDLGTTNSAAIIYPESTILSVKRLMGSGETLNVGGAQRSPEDICAEILRKLKTFAC